MVVLGLATSHCRKLTWKMKFEAGTSKGRLPLISLWLLAVFVGTGTRVTPVPPAEYIHTYISWWKWDPEWFKKLRNKRPRVLKFFIFSDVSHTRPAAARPFCAMEVELLLYVPWGWMSQWNQNCRERNANELAGMLSTGQKGSFQRVSPFPTGVLPLASQSGLHRS